jgi:putative ABC transport system substrate-binding protein
VDVIVVTSSLLAGMAREATGTIPIVSIGARGERTLVGEGLAASLARPGGNVTGLTPMLLGPKRLELLKEAVPSAARIVLLWDANTTNPVAPGAPGGPLADAAETKGIEFHLVGVRSAEDIRASLEGIVGERPDALFVWPSPLMTVQRPLIIDLAARHRLPAMYPQTDFVRDGGLMAYQANSAAMARRAAYYVDRILKGAKPADLPVEQPTVFDFVINLKTAHALGLTIPPHVLVQATEVLH